MPDECKTDKKQQPHIFGPDPSTKNYSWFSGQVQLKPFQLAEGEKKEFTIELDFSEGFQNGRDWSVVAWGENGPVSVSHKSGTESAKLPVLER